MMSQLPLNTTLLREYESTLTGKATGTVTGYIRALRKLTFWLDASMGGQGQFHADHFTQPVMARYLAELEQAGYSESHRTLVKAAIGGFALWLIQKDLLQVNPVWGLSIATPPPSPPRVLTPDQRYILQDLDERYNNRRGGALFALAYWAGCRVSEISWLRMEDTRIGLRSAIVSVGYQGGQMRQLDLCIQAGRALNEYIQYGGRNPTSPFVFTSQRSDRLTNGGIHHWFRALKAQATPRSWEFIRDVTFYDLRHDFGHRAYEAGWTLQEIAHYLGHSTKGGKLALLTAMQYAPVNREQIQKKLKLLG